MMNRAALQQASTPPFINSPPSLKRRYRGYATSDLKMLETEKEIGEQNGASSTTTHTNAPATTERGLQGPKQDNKPANPNFKPIGSPKVNVEAAREGKRVWIPKPSGGWKVGVTDRGINPRGNGSPSNISPSSSSSALATSKDVFVDDEPMMKTLMPTTTLQPSGHRQVWDSSSPLSSQENSILRRSANGFALSEDDMEDDADMDEEAEEYMTEESLELDFELTSNSLAHKPISNSSEIPKSGSNSSLTLPTRPPAPQVPTAAISALLPQPPKFPATSPPASPTLSTASSSSSSLTSPSPPMLPPKPHAQSPIFQVAPNTSESKPGALLPQNSFNASLVPNKPMANDNFTGRIRPTTAMGIRRTYAGSEEDMGLVRRSELAGLSLPNFRKDYQVSILIQYSDSSKDVLEYKNRIHPNCAGSDIITECVSKTRKKVPSWIPPPDRYSTFELVIPARTDEDDEILMDLDTPIWKYCFLPGEVNRLVLRPKIPIPGTRVALKVRMERGPIRTMVFHAITPINMVIERIQHKAKGVESRGPPFTGLFVFDNKRGHFMENLNKTLGDYRLGNMDIIQIKRRRLMELCLKDQPAKSVMVPTDLTAAVLAEQMHEWLRLDPVNPATLSLIKIVPKKGTSEEMQLVLNAETEVRSFHFLKGDIIQLRRRKDSPISTPPTRPPGSPTSFIPGNTKNGMLRSSHTPNGSPVGANKTSHVIPRTTYSSMKLPNPHQLLHATNSVPSLGTENKLASRSHVADHMGTVVSTFQVAFAGSTHDSETFVAGVADPSFIQSGATRRFPPPKLKLGEVGVFQTIYGIHLWDSSIRLNMCGDLHITNYRLVFASYSDDTMSDYFVDVPLTTINRAEKFGDKNKPGLKLDCKDFRTLRFHFEKNNKDNRSQLRRILEDCLYPNMKQLFAFAYKSARSMVIMDTNRIDGWTLFDLQREWSRLGVGSGDKGSRWRISKLNEHYAYSKTYPSLLAVPASITDEELIPVFKYRSKGRLPVLSWLNSRTGASITRCSQPLTGVTKKTSYDDAHLINAIREAQGSADTRLHLLDARPRANAIANMAMGGGFEVMSGSAYNGCDLEFLNIGNIHVMRNSLSELKSLLETQPYDSGFLAKLESTGWLLHISLILQGAVKVVEHIQQRHSCVLHCSDGWDRTSQLSAIAMILLDPYYRTTVGLCVLIEKEWCSFGHKFAQRYGHIAIDHADKNFAHGERAPIFLHFVDCVWQVLRQFPCAFEYNENLLLIIMEHLYSCHFGTFLMDCERERNSDEIKSKTESLWTFVLEPENAPTFKNIFYEPFDSVLPLAPTLADVKLWRAYYRRWYAPPEEDKLHVDARVREIFETNEKQAERIKALELRLSALERF